MSKLSLLLLAVCAAFACAQVTVTIPGVVNPDVGAALSNAQKSGKVASAPGAKQSGAAQAPSAAMSQGQSGQQQSGQMQGGQSGIASQLQQAGVGSGGRHLLQGAPCFFSGQVGGTGIFVSNLCVLNNATLRLLCCRVARCADLRRVAARSDLCPFTPGAQPNSQCCAKGAFVLAAAPLGSTVSLCTKPANAALC